jgi:PAS domain-containing protein
VSVKPRGQTPLPAKPGDPDRAGEGHAHVHPPRRARATPPPHRPPDQHLAAAALEALPVPTVVVDGDLRVVTANAIARRLLGAHAGVPLGDALGCVDAKLPGSCGSGQRCATCTFRRTAQRAIHGETVRDRGFVMKGDSPENDLHLIARAGPFEHDGRLAILALDDINEILGDPGILRVCEGCGRVRDEEGGWHPLHRFLEDRLGVEASGPLCDDCASGGHRGR